MQANCNGIKHDPSTYINTHTESNEEDIYTVKAFFEENFGGGDREEREKEQREKARVSSPKRHGFVRV